MGYFAVVLARTDGGWEGNELDLDGIDDLGDLADAIRDSADTDGEDTFLLFLEQEDAWFAVVRVDGEDDPRVFVSDDGAIGHSAYAEMLLEGAGVVPGEPTLIDDLDTKSEDGADDEDTDEPAELETGPVGDPDLLADLGTAGDTLLALCAKEGLLPSEVLTTLAEAAGAADALESVR